MSVKDWKASGPPHEALSLVLAYLPLYELLSMNQACKSFRDAITNDILIWLEIIVERRLSFRITDESLIKIASKANGRPQNLTLLNCVRITDAGLMRVVNENPHISKVIHCMIQPKLHLILAPGNELHQAF